jgi:hypothetical protein
VQLFEHLVLTEGNFPFAAQEGAFCYRITPHFATPRAPHATASELAFRRSEQKKSHFART